MANNFPNPFEQWTQRYRVWRGKAPDAISQIALVEFKENFRRGGWRDGEGVTAWKPRSKKDKNPKKRALLVASGRLKRSLRKSPDFNTARVVTDVPYAAIHNDGGLVNTTASIKSHRRKKKKGGFSVVKAHSRKVKFTMPQRPFMKMGAGLSKNIDKYLGDSMDAVFGVSK